MKLSTKELMVLAYIALGYNDKEIAYKMGLSYYTIRTYIDRAILKLSARNKINAVVKCLTEMDGNAFLQILQKCNEVL